MQSEQNIRDYIATLRNSIENERAFTIDRVERLGRFMDGMRLYMRREDEWHRFHERTRPMQQEIDHYIELLARIASLTLPAPIVTNTHGT